MRLDVFGRVTAATEFVEIKRVESFEVSRLEDDVDASAIVVHSAKVTCRRWPEWDTD